MEKVKCRKCSGTIFVKEEQLRKVNAGFTEYFGTHCESCGANVRIKVKDGVLTMMPTLLDNNQKQH